VSLKTRTETGFELMSPRSRRRCDVGVSCRVDTGTKRNGSMKPEFEERVALDVDDILQASDEEILAEFTESHGDPARTRPTCARSLKEPSLPRTNVA
jgi:hypothetical protein